MRAFQFLVPLVSLAFVACGGGSDPKPGPATGTGTPTGTPTTTGTTDTTPTALGTNSGSLILHRKANQRMEPPTVQLVGLFPTSDPGLLNLAQCAVIGDTCLPQVPDIEDDWIDVDPDREFDPTQWEYSFAGTSVGIGPLEAYFQNVEMPHYYADLTDELAIEGFDGTYGVKIGGDWGEHDGWDDILVSPAMNVMSHDAGREFFFHDGEKIVFEWEPEGRGDVFLSIHSGTLLTRMWLLEDDGYFELDADSLGLGTEEIDMKMSIERWNHNTIDVNGNTLNVLSISEVAWPATYFYVGGRDEMVPVDTCGETNTMNEYLTGQYWGRLADDGFLDHMDPGFAGCTGFWARGEEGFVRFDLPPRTFLSVAFTLLNDDASLYLVTDCAQTNTCLVGSDVTYQAGEESFQYFNSSDTDQTVYAVLDGYLSTNGLFYADVSVNTMGPPDMFDTCAAVQGQLVPTPAGGYYSDITAYTNQIDPAQGACPPVPNLGPDAMTKVEVGPGETITVNVDMAGSDPAVYLLYNCADPNACANGSDIDVGPQEQVAYTNNSASTETLYLVVDSKTQLRPWFMTIDIQ